MNVVSRRPGGADSDRCDAQYRVRMQELLHRARSLEPDSPARWGTMNVLQMLVHVHAAYGMVLRGPDGLLPHTNVRFTPLRGPIARYLAFHAPLQWKQGLPTLPQLDVVARGCKLPAFLPGRHALEDDITRFFSAAPEDLAAHHPWFGRMRHRDWMQWGLRHTDHHLRQFGV